VATLHVRNVPEPIYELLRDCAEREGRSIGAQAVVFIQQGLLPHATRRASRRRGGLQRFTSGAREVVVCAQDEARGLGAPEVLPGHLLLGLLAVEGPARAALEEVGVTAEEIRATLSPGDASPRRLKFSPAAKQALEQALRESLALRHDYIGGEHLLLALEGDPLLEPHNVRAAVALAQARPHAAMQFAAPTSADAPEYLTVDLDGTAERWTTALNTLADEGWELMQVVDHRAILRRG
jgi:ATP-dependent Clp protease ATP-binding subunit ClpA